MILAYLALYSGAVALAALGLLIPAILVAVCAHGLAHAPALLRVKPLPDIHG